MAHVNNDSVVDWGRTSHDYATHRPNYPRRFFDLLACFGIGTAGQTVLDLGTGVGFLLLVRHAEDTRLPDASFDVVTASQSWLYFDAHILQPAVSVHSQSTQR